MGNKFGKRKGKKNLCHFEIKQKNNSSILAFGIGRPMAHDLNLKERYRGKIRWCGG